MCLTVKSKTLYFLMGEMSLIHKRCLHSGLSILLNMLRRPFVRLLQSLALLPLLLRILL